MVSISWTRLMNLPAKKHEAYQPTCIEQVANTVTHGLFVVPAIFAVVLLHQNSVALQLTTAHHVIALIYGLAFILVFSISTIFHAVSLSGKARSLQFVLHLTDRGIIYFFIAASYMPWLVLRDMGGVGEFISWFLWCLAATGTIYSYMFHEKYKTVETIFYLIIGICPSLPMVFAATDTAGLVEVGLGGAFYVTGVVFFKSDGRIPFAHAVWHLFCAAGAWFHFYAVYTHLYQEVR